MESVEAEGDYHEHLVTLAAVTFVWDLTLWHLLGGAHLSASRTSAGAELAAEPASCGVT